MGFLSHEAGQVAHAASDTESNQAQLAQIISTAVSEGQATVAMHEGEAQDAYQGVLVRLEESGQRLTTLLVQAHGNLTDAVSTYAQTESENASSIGAASF